MLRFILFVNLLLCPIVISKRRQHKAKANNEADDLGGRLVSALRNDVNIDLPADEEYEDLRAELLAYHTALASITSKNTRRSMKTTPCWKLGGICIDHKMCAGHHYLTEVPGCKNNLEVCCFTWNNFHVRDMTDKGVSILTMPWSLNTEFGGKGVIGPYSHEMATNKHSNEKHDKNHHGAHHENVHHDSPQHKNLHHEDSHHENAHYDNPHQENSNLEKLDNEKLYHDNLKYYDKEADRHTMDLKGRQGKLIKHKKSPEPEPPLVIILKAKK